MHGQTMTRMMGRPQSIYKPEGVVDYEETSATEKVVKEKSVDKVSSTREEILIWCS